MKKNLNLVTAIAIIGLAAFSGCTKSSSLSNTMTATISSASFSKTCGFNIDSAGAGLNTGAGLNILGSDNIYGLWGNANYPSINLFIVNYTVGQTGTFNITTSNITGTGTTAFIDSISTIGGLYASAIAQTGSIIITSASSSQIVGTFSFTCTDGTTVTNGSFNTSLYFY
jgi:hypothetical protein